MSCPRQTPPRRVAQPGGAPPHRPTALVVAAVTSLWLAGATAFAVAQEISLDSILARLAERPHGHALYTEEVQSALLKHPLHSSGELFFDAPDRLEKKALQPVAQDLIVEGDVLTVVRGKHRASMQLGDYPQLRPLLTGLRATLAGDRSTLEKNFQVAMATSGSAWTLTLQPLSTETAPVYRHIEIRGTEGHVQGVTLERVNGERTIMSLTEPAGP